MSNVVMKDYFCPTDLYEVLDTCEILTYTVLLD